MSPHFSGWKPASTTTAPSLIQSALMNSGRPTAPTTMSACLTNSGRFWVRLWQMVTVALAPSSISAMGLPRMALRPTTTACLPSSGIW